MLATFSNNLAHAKPVGCRLIPGSLLSRPSLKTASFLKKTASFLKKMASFQNRRRLSTTYRLSIGFERVRIMAVSLILNDIPASYLISQFFLQIRDDRGAGVPHFPLSFRAICLLYHFTAKDPNSLETGLWMHQFRYLFILNDIPALLFNFVRKRSREIPSDGAYVGYSFILVTFVL